VAWKDALESFMKKRANWKTQERFERKKIFNNAIMEDLEGLAWVRRMTKTGKWGKCYQAHAAQRLI